MRDTLERGTQMLHHRIDWFIFFVNWDGILRNEFFFAWIISLLHDKSLSKNAFSNQFRDLPEMILIDKIFAFILQSYAFDFLVVCGRSQEIKGSDAIYKNHRHPGTVCVLFSSEPFSDILNSWMDAV